MACGPAIARDARARGLQLDSLTGESVARAANAGDELARAVMDDAARALGFGIGTAITLINPTRVVIGGGVSKSGERWWSVVRASARANTLPQIRADIVPAALGDDAPLWGAIARARAL
jgi:glucokinase